MPRGLDAEPQPGAVCCYARQDKVWAHDPDGVAWEYYTPSWRTSRHHDRPAPPARRRSPRRGRPGGGIGGLAAAGPPGPDPVLADFGVDGHRGVAIAAAVAVGSVALLGFGLDSGIEAMTSVIVIWRFTGARLASATSERRAQQLVAVSFFLLAPYIAAEAIRALVAGDRAETSIIELVLTAGTAVFEPTLGVAKRWIGARLGSPATAGEGTQNLLCATWRSRCSPGWPPTPCGAPGGSMAWSPWGSLAGPSSRGAERGPGNRADAQPSQAHAAEPRS